MASVTQLDGVAQLQVAKAAATAKIEEARTSALFQFHIARRAHQEVKTSKKRGGSRGGFVQNWMRGSHKGAWTKGRQTPSDCFSIRNTTRKLDVESKRLLSRLFGSSNNVTTKIRNPRSAVLSLRFLPLIRWPIGTSKTYSESPQYISCPFDRVNDRLAVLPWFLWYLMRASSKRVCVLGLYHILAPSGRHETDIIVTRTIWEAYERTFGGFWTDLEVGKA